MTTPPYPRAPWSAWTGRRRFLGVTGALLVGATIGGCSNQDEPATEAIDRLLTEAFGDAGSGTVLAAVSGETVYCQGFGLADREHEIAADCRTVYDIGSVTEQFTGAAILRLEMDGDLSTGDPVKRFSDGIPDDKRDITVHHLLTHTAGLDELAGADDYEALSRDDMLAGATAAELLWPPGSRHHYSNLGYSVLAAIIETVTGTGYEDYLVEQLFLPVGMAQTGYRRPAFDPARVAVQYDVDGIAQGKPNELPWDHDGPYWALRGNGGILSTAEDMFAWHLALQGDEILSAAAKAKLFEPYVPEDDSGQSHYSYGWAIESDRDGGTLALHNGGNGWSYCEYVRAIDADLMVFLASNANGPSVESLDLPMWFVDVLRDHDG